MAGSDKNLRFVKMALNLKALFEMDGI